MAAELSALASTLRARGGELAQMSVAAGFDGFVDEMISVVGERSGLESYTPVKDMTEFAGIIAAAAGKSSLREIVVHRFDAGGCSVNLGDGLMALGVHLDCFATLGQPMHPAFEPFAKQCRTCVPWGSSYGRTLAFEFADGKFMFSAVAQLGEFNPELIGRVLADGRYAKAAAEAKLIALTNWTLYPHMTECWAKLQRDVYSKLTHKPWVFIDLVDPTGRADADIRAMLEVAPGFEGSARTVLGLNCNEANAMCRAWGLARCEDAIEPVKAQAKVLREKLGISEVVIHAVKYAVTANAGGVYGVEGPYCAAPKKSTGAGDRFNAGYCAGLMLGLPTKQCLQLGCASSGFFVRAARSGSVIELAVFLEQWQRGDV